MFTSLQVLEDKTAGLVAKARLPSDGEEVTYKLVYLSECDVLLSICLCLMRCKGSSSDAFPS